MTTRPITDIEVALDIALDESKLESDREDKILRILDYSAGSKSDGTLCYRPWYAAAKALDEDLDTQALVKADGAQFTGQIRPIRSLYNAQHSIDLVDGARHGIVVPPEFSASVALEQLNEGVTGESVAVMSIQVG